MNLNLNNGPLSKCKLFIDSHGRGYKILVIIRDADLKQWYLWWIFFQENSKNYKIITSMLISMTLFGIADENQGPISQRVAINHKFS